MEHRIVIQRSIVAVIATVILWSIVNVAQYARIYHDSLIVWTLGSAIGAANAISVYSFVIARSNRSRWPSAIGVLLFGCMSGALQTLLYLHGNAPLLASIVFGWFGPFAEGVLAWLHAALTEEGLPPKKAAQRASSKTAELHSEDAHVAQDNAQPMHTDVQAEPDKKARARQLLSEGLTRAQIASELDVHRNTVAKYLNGEKETV